MCVCVCVCARARARVTSIPLSGGRSFLIIVQKIHIDVDLGVSVSPQGIPFDLFPLFS